MKTKEYDKVRGGRPAKFDEPSRPVTLTLPDRILERIKEIDGDRAKGIVKAVETVLAGGACGPAAEPVGELRVAKDESLLGGARISTIDSFYLDLVRAHFDAVDFPPVFRSAAKEELTALSHEVMNDVIDKMYREDRDFPMLEDIFCDLKSETKLTDVLLGISERLFNLPESIDFLMKSAEELEKSAKTSATPQNAWYDRFFADMKKLGEDGEKLYTYATNYVATFGDPQRLKKYAVYGELLQRTKDMQKYADERNIDALSKTLCDPIGKVGSQPINGKSAEEELLQALCKAYNEKIKERGVFLNAFGQAVRQSDAKKQAAALRLLHKTLSLYLDASFAEK